MLAQVLGMKDKQRFVDVVLGMLSRCLLSYVEIRIRVKYNVPSTTFPMTGGTVGSPTIWEILSAWTVEFKATRVSVRTIIVYIENCCK